MKIDNSLKSVGTPAGESRTAKSGKASADNKAPENRATESGVNVELSGLSTQIQTARMSGGEVADAARVSEIRQAIAEGRFKVNPDVVADRLLRTVQELITAYRH